MLQSIVISDDPGLGSAVRGTAEPAHVRPPLEVRRLGTIAYADGLALQEQLVQQRRAGRIPDTLLLLDHPHVITLGSDASTAHVLSDEDERRLLGIELYETGRGGDVTYHGPGQLVGYPILDLKPDRKDLHRYLRDLEHVLIDVAAAFGITAYRREALTGVWTDGGKLAAIGVRVSSGWITSHGFALNVSTDLRYFDSIVPCGIQGAVVTSLERELGKPCGMETVQDAVVNAMAAHFARAARSIQASGEP
jgi:lipoyl(octanoyl) transferase